MKKRIDVEYIINTVISAVMMLIGLVVTCFCGSGVIEMQQQFNDMASSDNGLVTVLFIFLGPILAIAIGLAIIILIVYGIAPILMGIATVSLSAYARFSCTEGGTVITTKYKALMTANYVVMGVFVAQLIAGLILLAVTVFFS